MLNEDFKDLLAAFSAEQVDFLLVGAYALAAHGFPRATGDIDLWVQPVPANADRVFRALAAFGAPLTGITPQDFTIPDTVFQIGVPPRRVDILTSVSGLAYADARQAAIQANLESFTVWVLSREDLIRNKRASGRPRDLLDVQVLEGQRKKPPKT